MKVREHLRRASYFARVSEELSDKAWIKSAHAHPLTATVLVEQKKTVKAVADSARERGLFVVRGVRPSRRTLVGNTANDLRR